TTARSPSRKGWPGSSAPSSPRSAPATTCWCCSACTGSTRATPAARSCSTAARSAGWRSDRSACRSWGSGEGVVVEREALDRLAGVARGRRSQQHRVALVVVVVAARRAARTLVEDGVVHPLEHVREELPVSG